MDSEIFETAYEGQPPWDIGGPQPEIVRLAEEGAIRGVVLDVGCGTGENALYLDGRGCDVWGIDFIPKAIERAREGDPARAGRPLPGRRRAEARGARPNVRHGHRLGTVPHVH
jgi:SAM-dependent methyltransferase